MAVLIITYDLRTPKDYHDFYEAIKSQGEQGKWWHYMTSTWLLSTTKNPQQVFDAIHPHLDTQDFLLVCELSANYQGWLPKQAWDWVKSELPVPNPFWSGFAALSRIPPPPGLEPSNPFLAGTGKGHTSLADLLGNIAPKKPGER